MEDHFLSPDFAKLRRTGGDMIMTHSSAPSRFFQRIVALGGILSLTVCLTQCSKLPTGGEGVRKAAVLSEVQESGQVLGDVNSNTCRDGIQPSGALYRMCMPDLWNGDLVVYAHGYVDPREPLSIPDDEVGDRHISEIVNELGYAFATTSYRANGLVVPDAVHDLIELVNLFFDEYGDPNHVYLVGASEGGLITALAVETYPHTFHGGLAGCGPVGNFRRQLNHFGDFRVVFDYFFPEVIPGSPVDIPEEVIDEWDLVYEQKVKDAIRAAPHATEQLLRVTCAPTDPWDAASIEETILGALRYNVLATNNAVDKLGGQPFDNRKRIYIGSKDDFRLNRQIQRVRADEAALDEIASNYETSGCLVSPLVTIHTTRDEIVPYWHEPFYRWRVFTCGSGLLHTNIPVFRYGHCNFRVYEVLVAFAALVFQVTAQELIVADSVLPDAESQSEFLRLAREQGLQPKIVPRSAL